MTLVFFITQAKLPFLLSKGSGHVRITDTPHGLFESQKFCAQIAVNVGPCLMHQ
jgi:hypothetical protein